MYKKCELNFRNRANAEVRNCFVGWCAIAFISMRYNNKCNIIINVNLDDKHVVEKKTQPLHKCADGQERHSDTRIRCYDIFVVLFFGIHNCFHLFLSRWHYGSSFFFSLTSCNFFHGPIATQRVALSP